MRYFLFLIALVPLKFIAQEMTFDRRTQLIDSVQNKLKIDTLVFEQFVFLGKCNCLDEVAKSNNVRGAKKYPHTNFHDGYIELETLNFPLAILFSSETIKQSFSDYQKVKYKEIVETFNNREDFYKNRTKYPLLPCERIYNSNEELMILYTEMISNSQSYKDDNKLVEYLKTVTYLNSVGW